MEMISIPREQYEKMIRQISLLREIEKLDIDLVRQFRNGLNDLKSGNILRVA